MLGCDVSFDKSQSNVVADKQTIREKQTTHGEDKQGLRQITFNGL